MIDESGWLDKVRGILASGRPDAEIVGAIREVILPPPRPQLEVRLDHRRWPILCSSSAGERNGNPEMP
ncbi:hypothetical protein [Kribbella sp. NPDC051620]|uniref:hypothetical protein n=1 Tax=Kribbella sp. NPDC051620 TaxID=3364120 RepID=UPI0037A021CD